ncbi:MAG: cell division protein FtsQ/DivIB [Akkermansia sp.]
MGKARNRFRSEQRGTSTIRLLEGALTLRNRFFSLLALRRGFRRVRRWALWLLALLPLAALLWWGADYALDKAYSMSLDKVEYESHRGLISKQQALDLLGLKGSVNVASIRVGEMEKLLESNPCIEYAHIRADLPDTLSIELEERVPIAYAEPESATDTGTRHRLFMDPKGVLFPVVEEYHRDFMGVPVWYLQPGDVAEFREGAVVTERARRPIVELIAAANNYTLREIPAIREIFRPKEWKIILTLDDGTEVLMQVYDIKGQMERLAMVLEHARATGRSLRSADVIPRLNPAVIYAEQPDKTEP